MLRQGAIPRRMPQHRPRLHVPTSCVYTALTTDIAPTSQLPGRKRMYGVFRTRRLSGIFGFGIFVTSGSILPAMQWP
jgi:hypothetical protein